MSEVVQRVAAHLDDLARSHARPLVAVDGPDAAGKTSFADAVAALMTEPVCRASIDGFHRPAAQRMRRGPLSAEGCYRDSFDHTAFVERLSEPFARGESEVALAVFDYAGDQPREEFVPVESRCLLLVDGVFLLRPELRDQWTWSVYLHVSEKESLERALCRDVVAMGSEDAVISRYRNRYLPAQELYRSEADPVHIADVVIDNDDWRSPRITKWSA